MRKSLIFILIFALVFATFSFTGCGLLDALTGNSSNSDGVEQLFDECTESTGTWYCYDYFTKEKTDVYFVFNGEKNAMHFEYYEGDVLKRDGVYRVVNRGTGSKVSVPLGIGFEIKGNSKYRDWLECYADDFKTDFTQFTVMDEYREADLSKSGTPVWHEYRLSEMPFKFGTYVKEGATLKEEKKDFEYADRYYIPSGEYVHESGAKFNLSRLIIHPRCCSAMSMTTRLLKASMGSVGTTIFSSRISTIMRAVSRLKSRQDSMAATSCISHQTTTFTAHLK